MRLINTDKLAKYKASGVSDLTEWQRGWNDAIDTIMNETPPIDAEPVVRCDDCIYRDGKTPGQPNILCWQMHSDDYCSYGTKRKVGTYCENIVSVVRCKDCEYYNGEYKYCVNDIFAKPNGYCSYGKRKEDAETD